MLKSVGLAPDGWRVNVHRRGLDELEGCYVNTGIMRQNAFRALGRLRRLRTQADYELNIHIRNQDISYALNLFTTYFNECCRILGVN